MLMYAVVRCATALPTPPEQIPARVAQLVARIGSGPLRLLRDDTEGAA